MVQAIVFLPLLAAIVAGLGNRMLGNFAAKLITTGALFASMALSWPIFLGFLAGTQHSAALSGARLDPFGRARGGLGAQGRRPDRGDAGGRDQRLGARPPLLLGLYGRGRQPAALLRLSEPVHLRDADAGDGRQPGPDVLRLGRGRPRLLPPDRLLVPQAFGERGGAEGVHRQPGRRFRLQPRHLRAPSSSSARSRSPRSCRPRRTWPARRSASLGCASTR